MHRPPRPCILPMSLRWRRLPKGKPVTIAAGFVHADGVLLGADTELTAPAVKMHGQKISYFDCKAGRIGFAFAGNVGFATVVIQLLERKLRLLDVPHPLPVIEKLIDREYRRLVHRHPFYGHDPGLDFGFVFAIQREGHPVELFATEGVTVQRIPTYKCIGVGEVFGIQLLQTHIRDGDPPERVLLRAAYAFALIKKHVPGCGGVSWFLDFRNDGSVVDTFDDAFVRRLGGTARLIHEGAWRLLQDMIVDTSEKRFRKHIGDFVADATRHRADIVPAKQAYDARVKAAVTRPPVRPSQGDRPVRRGSKHGQ